MTPPAAAPPPAPEQSASSLLHAALMETMQTPDDAPPPEEPNPAPANEEAAAEEEPASEETTDESAADTGEDEEAADPAELIKDPAALLTAHGEMTAKLKTRTEVLKSVAEKLGVTDLTKVSEALDTVLAASAAPSIPVTMPTPERPLASVAKPEDLTAATKFWQDRLDWCIENATGGDFTFHDDKGQPYQREVDAAFVKQQASLAQRVLTRDVPARAKFLADLKAEETKAGAAFPYFAATAPEAQRNVLLDIYKELKEAVPEIHHYPKISELLADATTGRLIRLHRHGAAMGADGKLKVNALTGSKPVAAPAKKSPPVSRAGVSTPPAKKTGPDQEFASALESGDLTAALKAELTRTHQFAA